MLAQTGLFSARSARTAAIGLLLSIPLLTLWNIAADSYAPRLKLTFGPSLGGVTETDEPVEWSVKAFLDGSLQSAITDAVTEALPTRPLLIRLSNSFRKRLFGLYGAPGVIAGDDGELIELPYLREYCTRDLAVLQEKATIWLPELRSLQDFYDARGKQFIYLRTPSKAAYMPEKFIRHYPCPNTEHERREYLPAYAALLAKAGIRVIDGAAMTHALRGRYDVELFPQGGVHWNQLGVAHAADALLAEINRRAGREIAPRLRWTYEITDRPTGTDTDLIDVVNVLFARPRYPVPKLTFAEDKPCAERPAARMKVAIVGGSFVHDPARMLIAEGCLRGLYTYNYLAGGVRGGLDYETVKQSSSPEELRLLRDADIVILEENEGDFPGMIHSRDFARIVLEN